MRAPLRVPAGGPGRTSTIPLVGSRKSAQHLQTSFLSLLPGSPHARKHTAAGVSGQGADSGTVEAKKAAGCRSALDLIASQNPQLPMHPVFQEILNSPSLKGTLFVPTAKAWCAGCRHGPG